MFRDVSFSDDYDNDLIFDLDGGSSDAIELSFDTINITKGKFIIEQQNKNIDPKNEDRLAVDPMLSIINSTIGSDILSIDDISDVNTDGLEFKITVANLQRDKDCVKKVENDKDDEKEDDCGNECFFDYMGKVTIRQNRFTFLDNEAISILNAKKLEFGGNTVELNMDNALYVTNVKELNISENTFEFVGKPPALHIVYKYSATDLDDFEYLPDGLGNKWRVTEFEDNCGDSDDADFASMKANQIKDVKIMKNQLGKLNKDTIKYKIDEKYDKKFAMKTFAAVGTSNRKPCKCPIPKANDDDDINANLTMGALNMQECLSPKYPPVLGNRADICAGKYPKSLSEKLEDSSNIRPWHLVLAVLLTIIITAIMVFVIVRFCCMPEEAKSRSVTPDA